MCMVAAIYVPIFNVCLRVILGLASLYIRMYVRVLHDVPEYVNSSSRYYLVDRLSYLVSVKVDLLYMYLVCDM